MAESSSSYPDGPISADIELMEVLDNLNDIAPIAVCHQLTEMSRLSRLITLNIVSCSPSLGNMNENKILTSKV